MIQIMRDFLTEYSRCGLIGQSAEVAGISRSQIIRWMKKYPKFQEAYDEVQKTFIENLEQVAIDRAKEKSDSLMITLLKAYDPDKYNPKHRVDLESQKGIPVYVIFNPDEIGPADTPEEVEKDEETED